MIFKQNDRFAIELSSQGNRFRCMDFRWRFTCRYSQIWVLKQSHGELCAQKAGYSCINYRDVEFPSFNKCWDGFETISSASHFNVISCRKSLVRSVSSAGNGNEKLT